MSTAGEGFTSDNATINETQWDSLIGDTNARLGGVTTKKTLEFVKLEPDQAYEIPTDSEIPCETVAEDLGEYITNQARLALGRNKIIAAIKAYEQPFWILDVRNENTFTKADIPYLLVQVGKPTASTNDVPGAYWQYLRPGDDLIFGRKHDYGGRFDYSPLMSREHFKIACDEDGRLSVTDLNSQNGTYLATASHRPKHMAKQPEPKSKPSTNPDSYPIKAPEPASITDKKPESVIVRKPLSADEMVDEIQSKLTRASVARHTNNQPDPAKASEPASTIDKPPILTQNSKAELVNTPNEPRILSEDESRELLRRTKGIEYSPVMNRLLTQVVYDDYYNAVLDAEDYEYAHHPGEWSLYREKNLPKEYEDRAEWSKDRWYQPKYALGEIGGAEVYLSHIIHPYEKLTYAVAYIGSPENGNLRRRVFYRSNSSALWRFIPTYGERKRPFYPESPGGWWYSKSEQGEDAINAPFAMQAALQKANQLETQQPSSDTKKPDIDKALKIALDPSLFSKKGSFGDLSGYTSKVRINNKEALTPEISHNSGRSELADPQELVVDHDASPNFDRGALYSWTIDDSPIYGKINAYCYASNDEKLRYLFFQEAEGESRAWVAAVEPVGAEVSSLGLNDGYIEPGCLTTPLYEYESQASGKHGINWGDYEDKPGNTPLKKRLSPYVGMWDYLSRIPMIQEFLTHQRGKKA